ncbi:hypothetical protein RFI_17404, partial [Reticulomyxa filosa]
MKPQNFDILFIYFLLTVIILTQGCASLINKVDFAMASSKLDGKEDEKDFAPPDNNQKQLDTFFGELESLKQQSTTTKKKKENPSDDLLNRMESFLEKHCKNLHLIQDSFAQRMTVNTWDSQDDFLSLNVSPYENVDNPVVLIQDQTDNTHYNKIATALSALCQEMIQLEKIAKTKFYNPLTMYGIIPPAGNEPGVDDKSKKNDTQETQMGRFVLYLFQCFFFFNSIFFLIKKKKICFPKKKKKFVK